MDAGDKKLIVALDVETDKEAYRLVDNLRKKVSTYKIGFQLFMKYGPEIVRKIAKRDVKIFLDLKFHDIPNTVANGVESIVPLGIFMFNVHASGGSEMMKAAVNSNVMTSTKNGIQKPLVLGVTVLTSIDQNILEKEVGVRRHIGEYVSHLANMAKQSGLDGVVASALEIGIIRRTCGEDFIIVTPGIRPAVENAPKDDQKRIITPTEAILRGADLIVVGRPIVKAENPMDAASMIIEEINKAVEEKSRQQRYHRGIVTHTSARVDNVQNFGSDRPQEHGYNPNYKRPHKHRFYKNFKKKGYNHAKPK